MRRLLGVTALALALGCSTQPSYTEGTMTQVGAYLPIDGTVYGVEVVNYLNGCKVTSVSNMPFKVDRVYASTNEYLWGAVKTADFTHTKVEAPK